MGLILFVIEIVEFNLFALLHSDKRQQQQQQQR